MKLVSVIGYFGEAGKLTIWGGAGELVKILSEKCLDTSQAEMGEPRAAVEESHNALLR